jgi:hypothetical protein
MKSHRVGKSSQVLYTDSF